MSVYIFMVYSGILFLVSYIFICFYHSHFSSQIKTGVYFLILALSLCMYFFPKNCSIHLYSKKNSIFTNIISVHCYNYYQCILSINSLKTLCQDSPWNEEKLRLEIPWRNHVHRKYTAVCKKYVREEAKISELGEGGKAKSHTH